MTTTIALVGRPNTGKSTLFNRLVGKRLALVNEEPGMTRDWKGHPASLFGLNFIILDTPGIKDFTETPLSKEMERQTEKAIEEASLILFLIDGKEGLSHVDREIGLWLRRQSKPVLLVVNKSESKTADLHDAFTLGLDHTIALSAKEGLGLDDLYEAIAPYVDGRSKKTSIDKPLFQMAFVGRPNAGKSTLINAILKEDRLLTSATAGSTRDAISIPLAWKDHIIKLYDTAGIRRRSAQKKFSEKMAVNDAKRTIQYAQVVGLIIDGEKPLDQQELVLAKHVIDEGRILILIVNKIDLVKDRAALERKIQYKLDVSLTQVKNIRVLYLSAIRDQNFDLIFQTAVDLYETWNKRIATSAMNRWLEDAVSSHPPPLVQGTRIKIRYATQIKTRPPTFAMFISKPKDLPTSYMRYMENRLRADFDFNGVPLRLLARKGKNPYMDDKK